MIILLCLAWYYFIGTSRHWPTRNNVEHLGLRR